MEDSMINMPDLVFDEKTGNKRVRDNGEDQEVHKGRLEKRPSGILGVDGGGDYTGDGSNEGGESGRINGGGGGIIDSFISNVFQKNKSGDEDEVKTSVVDVGEVEDKREDRLGVDSSGGDADGGGGGGGGGGIIGSFFSNIFQHNGSVDEDGEQAKSGDLVLHEVAEKMAEGLGGAPGGGGDGGGELVDATGGKLTEKKDEVGDLASKDPTGHTLNLKPDEYSERVFFLNNN